MNGEKHVHQSGQKKDASEEMKTAVSSSEVTEQKPVAGSGQAADEMDEKTIQEKLTALETENQELKDKYLRKYADFENYKKRITKEREESAKYSNAALLLDIVAIIDDFERAIKSAEDGKDFKKFHEGISLIEKQLVSILEKKWGLERIKAKDEPFNPERHEALMAEQSADVDKAMVVEDLQSGYLLHGRVLRPSKVKVKQPLTEANTNPDQGGQ